jgi:hypothetical protein
MLQTFSDAAAVPIPVGYGNASALPGFGVRACRLDRRTADRLPIEQDVRYKVRTGNVVKAGFGRTVNISSTGVLFTTETTLAPGQRLEVAINWPALLDHKCPLKLVTTGRVVRSESGLAAITIDRYEFRTQGIHVEQDASTHRSSGGPTERPRGQEGRS